MNNKGQVLIAFVLILPLTILIIDFFIEQMNIVYHKNKVDNILELACYEQKIEEYIKINDSNLEIKITNKDNQIIITTQKKVNSILSKIVGINKFTIKNKKICEVEQ